MAHTPYHLFSYPVYLALCQLVHVFAYISMIAKRILTNFNALESFFNGVDVAILSLFF